MLITYQLKDEKHSIAERKLKLQVYKAEKEKKLLNEPLQQSFPFQGRIPLQPLHQISLQLPELPKSDFRNQEILIEEFLFF